MHFEIPVSDGLGKNGKKVKRPTLSERPKRQPKSTPTESIRTRDESSDGEISIDTPNNNTQRPKHVDHTHSAALDTKYRAQERQQVKSNTSPNRNRHQTDSSDAESDPRPTRTRHTQDQRRPPSASASRDAVALYVGRHQDVSPQHKVGMKPLVPYRADTDAAYRGNRERDFQTIHEELTHLRQVNKDYERIIAMLKADAVRLKQEMIVKGKDCEHFRDQFEMLRSGKDRDSNSHTTARQEWGRIIADRDHSIEKLQRDLGEARQIITGLTIQNERLVRDSDKDKAITHEEQSSAQEELKRLRYDYDRLVETSSAKEKAVQDASAGSGVVVAQLKQQIHELTVERNTMRGQLTSSVSSKEVDALRLQLEDAARARERVERNLKEDLAEANDQIGVLKKDKQRLSSNFAELEEKLWKLDRQRRSHKKHDSDSMDSDSSRGGARRKKSQALDASRSRSRLSQAVADDSHYAIAAAAKLRRHLADEEAAREDVEKHLASERRLREGAEAEISRLMGDHIKDIRRLEEEVRERDSELRSVKAHQKSSAALLDELKKDRSSARQNESSLNDSLSRTTATHHALQKELDMMKQEKSKLYSHNQAQGELLIKAEDEVLEYRLKLEHAHAEWRAADEARQQLVASVNTLQDSLTEQEHANASLLRKLNKLESNVAELTEDGDATTISTSRRASVGDGGGSNYNAGGSPAHIASLQHQLANLQRELDEERGVSKQLLEDLKDARSKMDTEGAGNEKFLATVKEDMLKSVAAAEAREIEAKKVAEGLSEELVTVNEKLELEIDEKAQALELLTELERKGQELEEKMFELREELKGTQAQCVELRQEQEAVRAELRVQLEEKEEQLLNLEEDLELASKNLKKTIADSDEDHKRMAKEIETQANAYTFMEEQYTKATSTIGELEMKMKDLSTDLSTKALHAEQLSSEIAEKDSQIVAVNDALSAKTRELVAACADVSLLQSAKASLEKDIAAAHTTITEKMNEVDMLKQLLVAQKEALADNIAAHDATTRELTSNFDKNRADLTATINTLTAELEAVNQLHQSTLLSHRKEIETKVQEAAAAQTRFDELGAVVDSLKKDKSVERKNFVDQLDLDKKAMLTRVRTAEAKNKDLTLSAEIKSKQLKEEMQARKAAEKELKELVAKQEDEHLVAMKALTDDYESQLDALRKRAGDDGDDVSDLKRRLSEALRELKHIKQVQLHW